jgi:uncharacterized membrane protein
MTPLQYVYVYLATVPIFFAVDMIWLGLIAKNIYREYLGYLLRDPINWSAALIFYCIFIVGLLYFAIIPALKEGSLMHAALYGALFGFFTYATYDLTNLATVKDWPLTISLIDMAWGTVLSAVVASLSFLAARTFIL